MGNLGLSDTRFPKPVFHGDTLKASTTVMSVRESKSNPMVGIVEFEHGMHHQGGEIVAICQRAAMMRRKTADTIA